MAKKDILIPSRDSVKIPPYIIVSGREHSSLLKQYTPWSLALQSLAYRDVKNILTSMFSSSDTGMTVADWVFRHTFNISRYTGKLGPLNFWNYPWQVQILNDDSKRICIQKSTQVGISEICLRKGVWFIITHPGTTLYYTLPDEGLANHFSDIRLETLVDNSPRLKSLLGSTDSYGRKQFGASWILVQSSFSKRGAQSTPVDFLVVDEEDFSMPGVRASLNERLSSSPHNYTIDISIPLRRGAGINRLWEQSTRNRWLIVCPYCSRLELNLDEVKDIWEFQRWLQRQPLFRQFLTLDHIKPVGDKQYDYVCERCNRVLDRRIGHWEFSLEEIKSKTLGGSVEYWSGYKVNQLCAPYISANTILKKKEDYRIGIFRGNESEADFNSHVLGEPPSIVSSDLRVPNEADFDRLLLRYRALEADDSGRCSMGIDWGGEDSWAVISKPMEFEGMDTPVRTIVLLIKVSGKDVLDHAQQFLYFIDRYKVGAVFADFGYGAAQNRVLSRALDSSPYRFWEVVSSNPTYKQIQAAPMRVYNARYDARSRCVHVMANTLMRRHIWCIFNAAFYMMRQNRELYNYWLRHHENITVEKINIPGLDIDITGFGRHGPDHLCKAACYDMLAYEFLRALERSAGDIARYTVDASRITPYGIKEEEEEEEEITIRTVKRKRRVITMKGV